jgi:hypothetical protein
MSSLVFFESTDRGGSVKNGNTTITVTIAELEAGSMYRVRGGVNWLAGELEGKIPDPTDPLLVLSDDGRRLEVVVCSWDHPVRTNGIHLEKVGVSVPPSDLQGRRLVQVGVCNAHHKK